VLPAHIIYFWIRWALFGVAVTAEIGHLALLDLRPRPTLGGRRVVVGCLRRGQIKPSAPKPDRQRPHKQKRERAQLEADKSGLRFHRFLTTVGLGPVISLGSSRRDRND